VLPLDSMLARLRSRELRRVPTAGAAPAASVPPAPRAELFVTEGESRAARARALVRYIEEKDTAGARRVTTVTGRVLLALKK